MGEKSDKIEWKFGCKLISWRKLSREKIICNFIAIEKDLSLIDNHKADFYGEVFLLFVIVLLLLACGEHRNIDNLILQSIMKTIAEYKILWKSLFEYRSGTEKSVMKSWLKREIPSLHKVEKQRGNIWDKLFHKFSVCLLSARKSNFKHVAID
jgi:hypothetical protein